MGLLGLQSHQVTGPEDVHAVYELGVVGTDSFVTLPLS